MIKKLQIENYRSCLRTTFAPQPNLSVLIGPNGSGKTTVLNALLLLRQLASGTYHRNNNADRRDAASRSKIKVWFGLGEQTLSYTAQLDLRVNESNRDEILRADEMWDLKAFGKTTRLPLSLGLRSPDSGLRRARSGVQRYTLRADAEAMANRVHADLRKYPEGLRDELVSFSQSLRTMQYFGVSQFTDPSECPLFVEIENRRVIGRGVRSDAYTNFLSDLYVGWKENLEVYEQFVSVLGSSGIGLFDDIHFQEVTTSSVTPSVGSGGRITENPRNTIMVVPTFKIGANTLSPNQLSEGTLKTMSLVFYLLSPAKSLLLIEEPEVCLHHGLLVTVIELIKSCSQERQTVVTTHSNVVLDEVTPNDLYRVSRGERGTAVEYVPNTLSKTDLSALHEYLRTEGNLGEYWRHFTLEEDS